MTGEGFDCSRCGTFANPAVYRPGEPIRDRMEHGRLCSTCAYADIDAAISGFEAKVSAAVEALGEVLLDPESGGCEPKQAALLEALRWLEIETTCGDCLELECHGADEDDCDCARHEASVEARDRNRRLRAAGVIPAEGGA